MVNSRCLRATLGSPLVVLASVLMLLAPAGSAQEAPLPPKTPTVKSQPKKPATKPLPKPAAKPKEQPAEPGRLQTDDAEAEALPRLDASAKAPPKEASKTLPKEPSSKAAAKEDPSAKTLPKEEEAEPIETAPAKKELQASVGQTYLFRYKASPKEVLRWEISHQVDFDTTVSGTTQRAKTYSKSTKAWRVTEVKADGTFTFNHVVEDSAMWQELTGRARVEWDSKKDETVPSGFESVAASLNKVLLRIEMDNQGKIVKRTIEHRGPGAADEDDEHQMTLPLPKEPIPVGYSWHLPFDIKLPQEGGSVKIFKAREKFQLLSVEDGVATISNETQVLTPVRDPAIEAQLIQRGGRGEVKFDIARGRVISQQVDVDKSVVGFRGPASSIHYVSRFTEKLVDGQKKTASREKPAKSAE